MKTLADASRLLVEQKVALEDSAVAEYIRLQAERVTRNGGNLADWLLVRLDGEFELTPSAKGMKFGHGVSYGLRHKDTIKKVEVADDQSLMKKEEL